MFGVIPCNTITRVIQVTHPLGWCLELSLSTIWRAQAPSDVSGERSRRALSKATLFVCVCPQPIRHALEQSGSEIDGRDWIALSCGIPGICGSPIE